MENGKKEEHWGKAKKVQTFGWTQLFAVFTMGSCNSAAAVEQRWERGILWAAELAAGTSFPAQEMRQENKPN